MSAKRAKTLLADTPRARRRDPETSHIAARKIKESGSLTQQQHDARKYVRRYPGHTAAELGRLRSIAEVGTSRKWLHYRYEFNRRLSELEPIHVRVGTKRECEVLGSPCNVYWPV